MAMALLPWLHRGWEGSMWLVTRGHGRRGDYDSTSNAGMRGTRKRGAMVRDGPIMRP